MLRINIDIEYINWMVGNYMKAQWNKKVYIYPHTNDYTSLMFCMSVELLILECDQRANRALLCWGISVICWCVLAALCASDTVFCASRGSGNDSARGRGIFRAGAERQPPDWDHSVWVNYGWHHSSLCLVCDRCIVITRDLPVWIQHLAHIKGVLYIICSAPDSSARLALCD